MADLDGLLWLLILAGPFLFLQRRLQRETQAVFLLLTRRGDVSLVLFSLLFFPGVLLHETSHFIMARVLGVRTGRFSLVPRPMQDGRLQLGFVETASSDLVRDALIGVSPLLSGGLFVAYAGINPLGLTVFLHSSAYQDLQSFLGAISSLPNRPDFWLWLYLTFAISSTMLPSASDRRAWLPISIVVVLLFLVVLTSGVGPWLSLRMVYPMNLALKIVAAVLAIGTGVHLLLLPPLLVVHKFLSQTTGYKVV